jgi:diadenosine tetraphosphate (Ap4A) HIT family hydrolase
VADPNCLFCKKLAALPAHDVVWEFPHSVAFLGPWQYYQGHCILVARTHATELFHLRDDERHAYLDEMCELAEAIHSSFRPHKLNYELLGNQVPHLHWHLFPRYPDDPDSLRPAWVALERAEADEAEKLRLSTGSACREEIMKRLRGALKESSRRGAEAAEERS